MLLIPEDVGQKFFYQAPVSFISKVLCTSTGRILSLATWNHYDGDDWIFHSLVRACSQEIRPHPIQSSSI